MGFRIKVFIKNFSPPPKWRVSVIIVAGILMGTLVFTFYTSRAWSYVSDNPSTCVNCHIMRPEYMTWHHSSHREHATCNDCHVPHDNVFRKYYFKANDGLRHATIFTLNTYSQTITMRPPGRNVVQENCIRCHGNLTEFVKANVTYGQSVRGMGKLCWECHREVPHGRVKSLSATPFGNAPVPKSDTPDWLKELIK
jgi:cytochrome c nitrite reductase small subunit